MLIQTNVLPLVQKGLGWLDSYDTLGKARFADSVGLPEGALNVLAPPIREVQGNQFFVNYIPVNPLRAAGADKITAPRIEYYGDLTYGEAEGTANAGRLDIGITNQDYYTKRPHGYISISDQEVDRLTYAVTNGNIVGAIDIFQEKRQSAEVAWLRERELLLAIGRPEFGLFGFVTQPDIQRITFDVGLTAASDYDDIIAAISTGISAIADGTNDAFVPTDLVLPVKNHISLLGKTIPGSGNDTSVLKYLQDTYELGISRSPLLQGGPAQRGITPGIDADTSAAILFCRDVRAVEQAIPKPFTYKAPIQTRDGVEIAVHGDVMGLLAKFAKTIVVFAFPKS